MADRVQFHRPRHPNAVTKEFVRMAKEFGFPGMRLHGLWHTHVSLLLDAGVPIKAVSERLGHSSAVVTLNIYGHKMRRAEDQAVAVSGGMLAGVLGAA